MFSGGFCRKQAILVQCPFRHVLASVHLSDQVQDGDILARKEEPGRLQGFGAGLVLSLLDVPGDAQQAGQVVGLSCQVGLWF